MCYSAGAVIPETQNYVGRVEDMSVVSALVVPCVCQGSKGRWQGQSKIRQELPLQ